ncbi:ABC-type transport auxiliary lipoprotein family protein [Sphingomonas japonica]|uniref:Cholesterol transport system auxiliary component n=1 Tax=Sphingomonas japonica TaxID=511662 RepID=A0ABX0TYP0_9SPHN|nr:ABC-type transport auxiliary lipoprotein family protein [Sphingomonas japonica]NIJ23430.1 cholesterol transport system auxiliary component [Sphingomonas japonica]
MTKLLSLLAALPLSACISFGAEPPPSLLTLDPAATIATGQTQTGQAGTITIRVPQTPQELSVERVPVRSTDTSIAYVKDAQWVEPPARLFARLLGDTVTARTGRMVLTRRQSNVDPGAELTGELRSFGIDAATSEAVVTYDAAILRPGATNFEKRRFEARVPVAVVEASAVGVALNQAANQVAGEVADWVGR